MAGSIKVIDYELSKPLTTHRGLSGYISVLGLIRIHGVPIGYVSVPVKGDTCLQDDVFNAILKDHMHKIMKVLMVNAISAEMLKENFSFEALIATPPSGSRDNEGGCPSVTVALCTRDRTEGLPTCLDALCRLDYPKLDLLLVDNAPSSEATYKLVLNSYPKIRYVREECPGLNWARNRAITEARGEIVAYTDDDVVVDPQWIRALSRIFAMNTDVMAVTGLVVPYELETEAQRLFEYYGGFGRGFEMMWYRKDPAYEGKTATSFGAAGQCGTGANMAFRRRLLERNGGFDPALDVGTVTNGGGDLEMFFRILKEGHTLVYEPQAIVRHRHRYDYEGLRTQLANNGIGFSSYLVRSALYYKDERYSIFRFWFSWLWWWQLRRVIKSLLYPGRIPRELVLTELWGYVRGLARYPRARRRAVKLAQEQYPFDSSVASHGVTE